MGQAISRLDVPIVKATGGVLLIQTARTRRIYPKARVYAAGDASRPVRFSLMPLRLNELVIRDRFEQAEAMHALGCYRMRLVFIRLSCQTRACPVDTHRQARKIYEKRRKAHK